LFLGFLLFNASLPVAAVRAILPSPKGGADPVLSVSLPRSAEGRPSLSLSVILNVFRAGESLAKVPSLDKFGASLRGLSIVRLSLTPAVGGNGFVARGFGFCAGASDGCGGGVASCRSSRRIYVPIQNPGS